MIVVNDGLGAVSRLSYDAVNSAHLLLTGVYSGRNASFVHDLTTGITRRVTEVPPPQASSLAYASAM